MSSHLATPHHQSQAYWFSFPSLFRPLLLHRHCQCLPPPQMPPSLNISPFLSNPPQSILTSFSLFMQIVPCQPLQSPPLVAIYPIKQQVQCALFILSSIFDVYSSTTSKIHTPIARKNAKHSTLGFVRSTLFSSFPNSFHCHHHLPQTHQCHLCLPPHICSLCHCLALQGHTQHHRGRFHQITCVHRDHASLPYTLCVCAPLIAQYPSLVLKRNHQGCNRIRRHCHLFLPSRAHSMLSLLLSFSIHLSTVLTRPSSCCSWKLRFPSSLPCNPRGA